MRLIRPCLMGLSVRCVIRSAPIFARDAPQRATSVSQIPTLLSAPLARQSVITPLFESSFKAVIPRDPLLLAESVMPLLGELKIAPSFGGVDYKQTLGQNCGKRAARKLPNLPSLSGTHSIASLCAFLVRISTDNVS
ncbi:hypothetical protein BKA56DRAFT_179610 [Ilyonectria sp. MPI-CAGE-AT-0026]|nr:hypothetical protein BKA56DRAFT_179610 [Ilyonectria sp. MPI-CAGE-AT-0026]